MSRKIYGVEKVLAIPDIHVPNHDPSAIKVALDFQKDFKPDTTIIMGDLIDAPSIALHAEGRNDYSQSDEYALAGDILDLFEPDVLLEGNHEQRFRRPGSVPWELWEMLEPRRWFNVDDRGITWVPYTNVSNDIYRIGKMSFIHGFATGLYAARAECESFGCVAHGHTHRIQTYQPKHAFHRNTGFNIGCLCKLDLDYQTTNRPRGWAQGFGYGYFFKSGDFSFYTVRLIGDKFVINNQVYKR